MSKRIAVIGAGAAGLAAAWRLLQGGHEVVVYECSSSPGGLLSTAERAGVRADVAVQLLSSTYTETFALAEATGARELLVRSSGRDSLWRRGRGHAITYGSMASMVASGALPALLKLKLGAKYVPWLGMRGAKLDANALVRTALHEDGESIASWGHRELGDDFVEYLTYPLLGAYYGTPPERTSAALYHALAKVGLDVRVFALRGGAAAFARAVAGAIERAGGEFRYSDEVAAVLPAGGRVAVRGGGGESTFDAVVVATPPAAAAGLVAHEPTRSWLEQVHTRPAVSVTLWLRQRLRTECFGYSFPRREPPGDVIVAACVQSQKPGMAESGDALVVFPAPAFLDRHPDDATLRAAVPPALARALPGLERQIEEVSVTRLDGGYRVFAPGYIQRLAREPVPLPEGVVLAGDYLVAPTVEGAVRSGLAAAAQLGG